MFDRGRSHRPGPLWFLALSIEVAACGASVNPMSADDASATTDASPDAPGVDTSLRAEFIAAGFQNSCAISDGRVFCWGRNVGVLGSRVGDDSLVPVEVDPRLHGIVAVAVGAEHACALDAEGVVTCWGHNDRGQLGRGDADVHDDAADALLSPAQRIAAGAYHTCAVTRDTRSVHCWGANDRGQLGHETSDVCGGIPCSLRPLATIVDRAAEIATGDAHSCAVLEYGVVVCWGDDRSEQSAPACSSTTCSDHACCGAPVPLAGIDRGTAIAGGSAHSCARIDDGHVLCWGDNHELQSGAASGDIVMTPQAVPALEGRNVVAGGNHTCVRDDNGAVTCFGANGNGQCGVAPRATVGATRVRVAATAIAAGSEHTCAIAGDGTVQCWGSNRYGQLGDGTRVDSSSPQVVHLR